MITLLRFYCKAYNEQLSGVTTEQEPESSTNTPEWMAFVLNASFEIARIVQGPGFCIHGLVVVLVSLLIFPFFLFHYGFLNYDSCSVVSCYLYF